MVMKRGKVVKQAGRLSRCRNCGRAYRNLGASTPHKNGCCSHVCLDRR